MFADVAARLSERNKKAEEGDKKTEEEELKMKDEIQEGITLTARILKLNNNSNAVHNKSTFYKLATAERLINDTETTIESGSTIEIEGQTSIQDQRSNDLANIEVPIEIV